MTQEEFYDLAQLIHCMAYRIMDSNPVSEGRYLDAYRVFKSRHVEPEIEQSELPTAADVRGILAGDAELNAGRKDMPSVAAKLEDL